MEITQLKKIVLLLVILNVVGFCYAQNPQRDKSGIRVMFYNVENLFYPTNNPEKNDDEFTQEGARYWSFNRYYDKINKIAKTVIAVGEWEPPAVIGLCEVEEIQCLKDLVYNSPLKRFGYEIVFQECKDMRGIDVALLYRPDHFKFISFKSYELIFEEEGSRPTRDILYTKGVVNKDTLHFFVNHWPSRYGGQLATLPKRNFAAKVLKSKFDSILTSVPNANIIAMGDFNDHPDDESMLKILKAQKMAVNLGKSDLINLTWQYEHKKGTHKYDHEWGILDQFVVSQNLIDTTKGMYAGMNQSFIFDADYLLEAEKDGIGKTTNRTYIGFKYHGGYSDHLPIYLDITSIK
jgi:hypothetical protein